MHEERSQQESLLNKTTPPIEIYQEKHLYEHQLTHTPPHKITKQNTRNKPMNEQITTPSPQAHLISIFASGNNAN